MSITATAVLAFVVVAFSLVSAAVIWSAREDAVRYRRTHRSNPRSRFRAFLMEGSSATVRSVPCGLAALSVSISHHSPK